MDKLIANGIVPVYETESGATIDARRLHNGLQVGRDFSNWIKDRLEKYGFVENSDYSVYAKSGENPSGGRPSTEYALTLDCAKEIAMAEATEQGHAVRKYFIGVEKEWNSPAKFMARALVIANTELSKVMQENAVLKPKADFFDTVTNSKDAVDIGTASKVLNFSKGRTTLFRILRDKGILMATNIPYQEYCDRGYFRVIESTYTNKRTGDTHTNYKTVVYQRGLDYIRKLLIKQGYMKDAISA